MGIFISFFWISFIFSFICLPSSKQNYSILYILELYIRWHTLTHFCYTDSLSSTVSHCPQQKYTFCWAVRPYAASTRDSIVFTKQQHSYTVKCLIWISNSTRMKTKLLSFQFNPFRPFKYKSLKKNPFSNPSAFLVSSCSVFTLI